MIFILVIKGVFRLATGIDFFATLTFAKHLGATT